MIIWVDCPAGAKRGGAPVPGQGLAGLPNVVPDLPHGAQDGPLFLVRGQQAQALLRGELDVDAEPVGQQAQPVGEEGVGPGDGLGVNVPGKAVLLPEDAQGLDHPLGGVVRVPEDGRGEEEPLDIVAPVKADGEVGQLSGGEGGPGHVTGAAVDAVGAVVPACVGHQDLQQGNAPAVGGKGVAAPRHHGGPQLARPPHPGQAAGGAGGVVLGRVGEDGQLVQELHGPFPPF